MIQNRLDFHGIRALQVRLAAYESTALTIRIQRYDSLTALNHVVSRKWYEERNFLRPRANGYELLACRNQAIAPG